MPPFRGTRGLPRALDPFLLISPVPFLLIALSPTVDAPPVRALSQMLDAGQNDDWVQLAELPTRPTESELTELVLPSVKARRAAFTAALRALRDVDDGERRVGGGDDPNAGRNGGEKGGEKGGEESEESLAGARDEEPAKEAGLDELATDVHGAARDGDVAEGNAGDSFATQTLDWEQIADSGSALADLALYQDVALLRQRCHGSGVSFSSDAQGLHIIQRFGDSEAAEKRARSEGYGRLNGNVRGACLLLPDALSRGMASLEAFSVQRDTDKEERARCAAALLERSASEAAAIGQRWLAAQPLPRALQVEGAGWLAAAGFRVADEVAADDEEAQQLRAHGAGCVWKRLEQA